MSARLAFRKVTLEGLGIQVPEFEGLPILLLTKENPGSGERLVQIMGIVIGEVSSAGPNWYYEYEMLPRNVSSKQLTQWIENQGYRIGVFDQYGNFQSKAA